MGTNKRLDTVVELIKRTNQQLHDQSIVISETNKNILKVCTYLEKNSDTDEFIYNFNKTVTKISSNQGNPLDDYNVLASFFETIKERDLETSHIKGLANKSAFEQVLLTAQNLFNQLSKTPEVQTWLCQQEEVHREQAQLHTAEGSRLMSDYGITFNGSQYVYGEYLYNKLSDAVDYAKKQAARNTSN